ncbi:MAG: hypothetical protein C4519_23995 [Desulfobacteraceae bacterium]|nr:MAG: hypothetical protein C4519_23995 [Desulfobacteraceae bacterium]
MKKLCCCAFFAFALLTSPGFRAPAMGDAQVQVTIGVPLPPLIIPAPPPLLPIPGAYVYYPPDVDVDIFFHHDNWYRPHAGKWYRAKHHNGPWNIIHDGHVPRALIGISPSYRSVAHHYEKVPYHEVRRNHWDWEKNRHWDRDKNENRKPNQGEKHRKNNDRKDGHRNNDQHKHDHHK